MPQNFLYDEDARREQEEIKRQYNMITTIPPRTVVIRPSSVTTDREEDNSIFFLSWETASVIGAGTGTILALLKVFT